MGSKKKKKNQSTQTNQQQMAQLQAQNPAVSMDEMQGHQQAMQGSQMKQLAEAFNSMHSMGQAQMDNNPMAGLAQAFMGGGNPELSPDNPMAGLVAALGGGGQPSNGDMKLAGDMFDMSQFAQSQAPPQQPQQMPPVSPFMHGQYIANQGQANPRAPRTAGSLYDQMTGNPYAGIQKDV